MAFKYENTTDGDIYIAPSSPTDVCSHSFKRVARDKVECEKCKIGFFDSPQKPFPLKLE